MKDKKLVILYILMLIVGIALLFTKPTTEMPETESNKNIENKIEVVEVPVNKTLEKITIAVARHDIQKSHILNADDYSFRTIEIDTEITDKNQYITNASQIDAYVAKNYIQADTLLLHDLFVSPANQDYVLFTLKPDHFMYPFSVPKSDNYLFENLHSGDLVDLYIFYGDETVTIRGGASESKYVSPSRDFIANRIKPVIVGKRVLFFEKNETQKNTEQSVGNIQIELNNQEIKLLSTLRANAKIIMYPSVFKNYVEDGLQLLGDKEKNWPLSDKEIFVPTQINRLRGN